MIPESLDQYLIAQRRLDFDCMDRIQIQAYGQKAEEKKAVEIKKESLSNLFDNGDIKEAMLIVCEMIKDFETRISELEKNQNGK